MCCQMIYIMLKKELEKEINNFISTEIEWIPLIVLNCKEKSDDLLNFLMH